MIPDTLSPGRVCIPPPSQQAFLCVGVEQCSHFPCSLAGWELPLPGAPPAACRAQGLSSEHATATHVHVIHVLIPVPPLLHVGAQGRDGRGALFEGCKGRQATCR